MDLADYEKKFLRYETLPQPKITSSSSTSRSGRTRPAWSPAAVYVIKNRTDATDPPAARPLRSAT